MHKKIFFLAYRSKKTQEVSNQEDRKKNQTEAEEQCEEIDTRDFQTEKNNEIEPKKSDS